jgi:predicted phosphate transport protein (TIGR00153 family)
VVGSCVDLVKAARMRLRLTPQKREFFDLFTQASANARDIARLLVELLEDWPENKSRLRDIREAEHEGDRLTHAVINLLNRTFVTPFDRDDIYRLASAIDDVCDHVDEAADNIDAYEVQHVPKRAREQADVVYRAAARLHEAVERLEGFADSDRQLFSLRELEDEGDRLVREAIAELFRSETDPLMIIRWKDIHEQIEEAVDACENAADVLEAILVKNR